MIRFKGTGLGGGGGEREEDIYKADVKRRTRVLAPQTQMIFREILNFISPQQCFEAINRVVRVGMKMGSFEKRSTL